MLSSELNLITLSKIMADETDEEGRKFVEAQLWPWGPVCPHCGVIKSAYLMTVKVKQTKRQKEAEEPIKHRTLYKCKACRKPFTVRMGTIFEDSHIPLRHWVAAFHLLTSSKKGISSLQISRELHITHKSAWFMTMRICHAMTELNRDPLSGT